VGQHFQLLVLPYQILSLSFKLQKLLLVFALDISKLAILLDLFIQTRLQLVALLPCL